MRARHGQHVAALQDVLGQPLRAAGVGQAGIQNRVHQRKFGAAVRQTRPADDVADDEHVGLQCQLLGTKTLDQINAQRAQLLAHRRINARVATGDFVPRLARQRGHAAHKGAANSQDMYMHSVILS